MFKKNLKIKADAIRWSKFTRRNDAVFLTMHREVSIARLSVATLLAAVVSTAEAQTSVPEPGADRDAGTTEEVTVTASRVPMPMLQTARIVSVITREQIKDLPAQSVNDLLKYAAGVDVRQRGAFGIQTDISIGGGTHDQIVILLNGVNVSSPHTGHLAADLPVGPDDIERIEILEGAASRVYGTSAFSGAINIVTKSAGRQEASSAGRSRFGGSLSLSGGSYGTWGSDLSLGLQNGSTRHTLSGGWQQSDGGTANSDFQKFRAFYQGSSALSQTDLNWQLGMSGMDYGANTFYSGKFPNQHESNRRYMAALGAQTKGRIVLSPQLYWTRSLDHYQLIKHTSTGENFHMTDVYGASVNARSSWLLGTTSVGADIRNEGILSTSLGRPLDENLYVQIPGHSDRFYTKKDNRTNICYFLEHDVLLDRWTVSLGVMANMNTGLDYRYRLYPGVDVSYRPSPQWKLYASWNMAQRMPTFTDLYYKSPTNEGNTGLKPEKTSETTLGARYRTRGFEAHVRAFYRHEKSMIDWIMTEADSVNGFTTYHAANFKLDNMGLTADARILFPELLNANTPFRTLSVQYAYIHQKRHDDTPVYASSYALDYLRHKLVARLDMRLVSRLSASLTYRWQERMGSYIRYDALRQPDGTVSYAQARTAYRPYGLLDLRLSWAAPKYDVYVEGNNLTSHRYYDLGNVRQPGFWLMAGAKWKF